MSEEVKPPPGLGFGNPENFEQGLDELNRDGDHGEEEGGGGGTLTKKEVENFLSTLSRSKVEEDYEDAPQVDPTVLRKRRRRKKRYDAIIGYAPWLCFFAIVGGVVAVGGLFVTGAFDVVEPSPTLSPTSAPTLIPTTTPTLSPVPTPEPTSAPSATPSVSPTPPTISPTSSPSLQPTSSPTLLPTDSPSPLPTEAPTQLPTSAPSLSPLSSEELHALMSSRLRMTLGWSDVCGNGCTNGPMKFATFFDSSCVVTGTDSNCIPVPAQNRTFGSVNLDGTIGSDDRLYLQLNASSLSCGLATDADCATGTPTQQAIYAMGFLCVALGWSDVCSGCTTPPTRLTEWCVDSGLSTTLTGIGTLPGSLNMAGTPNDDDNFYISAFVHPSAPPLALLDYARANCHVTLGLRDLCNGCFDPPAKRGSVGFDGTCFDVVGSDSLCVGNYASVNADGVITGDDVFYAALTCS